MTWLRTPVAAAVKAMLEPLDTTVTVFDWPPATLNVPAYYVGYVRQVVSNAGAYGIDVVTLPVTAVAGPSEAAKVDQLIRAAKDALAADPSLGSTVSTSRVAGEDSWRILAVAGAEYAAADLVLDIRM